MQQFLMISQLFSYVVAVILYTSETKEGWGYPAPTNDTIHKLTLDLQVPYSTGFAVCSLWLRSQLAIVALRVSRGVNSPIL